MEMSVVESGHYEMSTQIDHLSLRPFQLPQIGVLAHRLDATAAHRNGLLAQNRTELLVGGHTRINIRVLENNVRLNRVCLSKVRPRLAFRRCTVGGTLRITQNAAIP